MAFVRQTNSAAGPQQVNNGVDSPAREIHAEPDKLLEASNSERLDFGAHARQAELIKGWRPWERSTGSTSADGKAVVARNASKGGQRQELRELSRTLREQRDALDDFDREVWAADL